MAKGFDVELKGQKELLAKMEKAQREVTRVLAGSLYVAGNLIMMQAKDQVPFRTGVLKSSGRVFEPQTVGDEVSVDLGFGGAAGEYAVIVHENGRGASFNNGKKAHYLSDPMQGGDSILGGILAKRLKDIL